MESTTSQQLKVGIFVALGIIILALSLIFLGEEQTFLSRNIVLKVKFAHVQGLSRGSIVSLAGVRVGNISDLVFSQDDDALVVVMTIDSAYRGRITQGSVASVKTLGALGDRYIYITPGPRDTAPHNSGDFLAADSADDFLDTIAKKGDQLASIADVISELQIFLKNLNHEGRSARLIQNMVDASSEMKDLARETKTLIRQARGEQGSENRLRDILRRLDSVLQKIDSGEGTLGALINDPSLHQKLVSLLGESPRKNYLKPLVRETIRHQDQRGTK